jgi:hypothetical protein
MFLEQYGVVAGVLLVLLVSVCALLLGRKAARGVTQFREEDHRRFEGRKRA